MTRDFSQFLPPSANTPPRQLSTIEVLGWQQFFAAQVDIEALAATPPVRIVEVHRSGLRVLGDGIDDTVPPSAELTVGDWLLLDREVPGESHRLDRKSLVKRRAPGHDRQVQLIAANIDTAFIVTSCNQDFNVARLERYIALALEAEIDPVVLLTKTDLADDPEPYIKEAEAISTQVPVMALDARAGEPKARLTDWCGKGKTVAFLGSSGVGKSTLTNALLGSQAIDTQAIREDDARGRHTTTRRQLHITSDEFMVLDTPGMRELQMTDAAYGIGSLFSDLDELATQCKFRDCQHESEPGCAITAALERGDIDAPRMARWRKLMAEDAFNSASLAQRKSKDKVLGKTIRAIQGKNKK